jgi:hypothetical protein
MIKLITSYFIIKNNDDESIQRNNEITQCLKYNIANELISKIYLYVDDSDAKMKALELDDKNKVEIISVGVQPLCSQLFQFANDNLKEELCMVSNSDIYLYKCDLDCFIRMKDKDVFALSRHEKNLKCEVLGFGSHDSFIFKSPVHIENIQNLAHIQNVGGSDDSIVNNLIDSGNNLYNPCFQIMIVHLHESKFRTYNSEKIAHGKYFVSQGFF